MKNTRNIKCLKVKQKELLIKAGISEITDDSVAVLKKYFKYLNASMKERKKMKRIALYYYKKNADNRHIGHDSRSEIYTILTVLGISFDIKNDTEEFKS